MLYRYSYLFNRKNVEFFTFHRYINLKTACFTSNHPCGSMFDCNFARRLFRKNVVFSLIRRVSRNRFRGPYRNRKRCRRRRGNRNRNRLRVWATSRIDRLREIRGDRTSRWNTSSSSRSPVPLRTLGFWRNWKSRQIDLKKAEKKEITFQPLRDRCAPRGRKII